MYRYSLKELRLYIDDEENQQHKVIALQKPLIASTLDDITRFIEKSAERLDWLPNGHKEAGIVIDLRA